jgi:hypothetical protein
MQAEMVTLAVAAGVDSEPLLRFACLRRLHGDVERYQEFLQVQVPKKIENK